jgi:hypothetical protein
MVRCTRCFPMQIAFPVSCALLGCTVISSNATRNAGTACFKIAVSFTMYSLKYSSAALPDVSFVIGDEFCSHNNMHLPLFSFVPVPLVTLDVFV